MVVFNQSNTAQFSVKNMPNSTNRGYTLVELMVGMFISLFMIAAAMTYMISSSQSFRTQSNDAFSSENARFVLEFLSQNIRLAGMNTSKELKIKIDAIYAGSICADIESRSNQNGDNTRCNVDDVNIPAGFASGASDRLAIDFVIQHLPGENQTGCNGNILPVPVGSTLRVVNVFWTADIDGDGVRSLYCQPLNHAAGTPIGVAAPIVDGVDAIQVQYGVDYILPGTTRGDGIIDAYHSYTNLVALQGAAIGSANLAWTRQVKAVKLALLVNAVVAQAEDSNTEAPINTQFQLLDGPPITVANDRLLRQIYSTTISLPNNSNI